MGGRGAAHWLEGRLESQSRGQSSGQWAVGSLDAAASRIAVGGPQLGLLNFVSAREAKAVGPHLRAPLSAHHPLSTATRECDFNDSLDKASHDPCVLVPDARPLAVRRPLGFHHQARRRLLPIPPSSQ
jgi:hypothetical protein